MKPTYKKDGIWASCPYVNALNDIESYPIGATMAYPTADYSFRHVLEIPEFTARAWMDAVGIRLIPGQGNLEDMVAPQDRVHWEDDLEYEMFGDGQGWMNKFAFVVAIRFNIVFAVYKHDFSCYLIKREF